MELTAMLRWVKSNSSELGDCLQNFVNCGDVDVPSCDPF